MSNAMKDLKLLLKTTTLKITRNAASLETKLKKWEVAQDFCKLLQL